MPLSVPAPFYIIALFSLVFCGCNAAKNSYARYTIPKTTEDVFVQYPKVPIKAVAVVLHGLNLKPNRMDDWTHLLATHGALVIRPVLFGHQGNSRDMLDVTDETWRRQFNDHMALAKQLANQHGVPLVFLGYSLGGLLGVEWVSQQEQERVFDKMVLLAPAITVPNYSLTALRVADLLRVNFTVPSPGPSYYKAGFGSSVNAFRALINIKNSLEEKHYRNANIKTLVITDIHDELILFTEIKNIIVTNKLSLWETELVDNSYAYRTHGYRHWIMNQDAVGQELWDKLSLRVLQFYHL